MSKYKLYKNIAKEKILNFLPRPLVGLVDISLVKENEVNLAVFTSDRNKVTLSGHAKSLIKQIDDLEPLVVVGLVFTEEASDLLREHTPYFFCWQDDFWDDESYIRIRQGIPLH